MIDNTATKRNNTSVLMAVDVLHVDDFLDDDDDDGDDDNDEPLLGELLVGVENDC
jgi:hypothetical protein